MKTREYRCSKCGRPIISGQGMRMVTDKQEDLFYCKVCLKEAMSILIIKANKTTDEISLLAGIRRFLKYETH